MSLASRLVLVVATGALTVGAACGAGPSKAPQTVSNSTTTLSGQGGQMEAAAAAMTATTVAAGPLGWLASDATSATFIQWTETNGVLSGSSQAVTAKGQAPSSTTSSSTATVTGTHQGSTVSLTLSNGMSGMFGASQTYVGSLGHGALTVNFPQPDGTLQAVAFEPATADDYNSAVGRLQGELSQANVTVAAQQQQAQQAAATRREQQRQAALATWNALPTCEADDASRAAENGYADFVDCHFPDGHTQVCKPYYPDGVDGLPKGTACPGHWRTPSQTWNGIGTAPNGYPTVVPR